MLLIISVTLIHTAGPWERSKMLDFRVREVRGTETVLVPLELQIVSLLHHCRSVLTTPLGYGTKEGDWNEA